MAEFDPTKLIEYLKSALPQADAALTSTAEKMNQLARANKQTGQEYLDLQKKTEMLTALKSGLSTAIGNVGGSMSALIQKVPELKDALDRVLGPTENMAMALGSKLFDAAKNSAGLLATSLSQGIRGLVNPLADTSQAISTATARLGKFGDFLRGLNEAQKNLIAAQDPMRTAFIMAGQSIESANAAVQDYAQQLRATQFASNFAAKDIQAFNTVVGADLPKGMRIGDEALTEISNILKTDVVTANTAAMTAFRAFGVTGTEAAQATRKAYREFNQNQVETVRQLGIMHQAAATLGVNVELARAHIEKASGHLAIFGQKIGAATSMWQTFMGSLKGTVPIEEVGRMVDQLTQGLARMTVQNRAFISMMSGMGRGATALGGALKMELAMRGPEGMERHMQSLTQTLQGFAGGRIITLEQAERNPQLQQQFFIQREMLGKLTGMTTTEQQNRVLETLQKVQSGGMSQVDAAGAMRKILEKGENLQKQTVTELEKHTRFWQISLGQMTDIPIQDFTSAMAQYFDPIFGQVGPETADPTQQILNNTKLFGEYMKGAAEGTLLGVKRLVRAEGGPLEGVTRHGRPREELQPGWFERGLLAARGMLLTQPGGGREALRPPTEAAGRVRMPEVRRPGTAVGAVRAPQTLRVQGFRNLTANVAQGNQIIHRDLQQLISTTREGLTAVKETKPAAEVPAAGVAAAGEKTITVRIVGDESTVFEKLADKIKEWKNDMELTQQRQTLGIYD